MSQVLATTTKKSLKEEIMEGCKREKTNNL
jgi:hypothetical protein